MLLHCYLFLLLFILLHAIFFSSCFVVCSIHLNNAYSIDGIQGNSKEYQNGLARMKRNVHITSVNDDKNHNKLFMTL